MFPHRIGMGYCRRIQQLKSKKRRGREAGRGPATENGSHAGAGSRAGSSVRAEQDAIASSLATALQGAPRAVLEACLESLGYGSGELYEAAKDILAVFLKPPATPPMGEPRKQTAQGEGSNMVTRALEPDAKAAEWLRDTVQATLGECCYMWSYGASAPFFLEMCVMLKHGSSEAMDNYVNSASHLVYSIHCKANRFDKV